LFLDNLKNYFYADSYDNYAKIYFGEYNEGISVSDILNRNTDFFPESHGKIFELNPFLENMLKIFVNSAKNKKK